MVPCHLCLVFQKYCSGLLGVVGLFACVFTVCGVLLYGLKYRYIINMGFGKWYAQCMSSSLYLCWC
jgi:hypothetical protein